MKSFGFLIRHNTLKDIFAGVAALALTFGTVAGFTSCTTKNAKIESTSKNVPEPSSYSTMADPKDTQPKETLFTTDPNIITTTENTDPVPAEVPIQQINAFADSLKAKNFSVDAENKTRKQVGDLVELELPDGTRKIVSLEDNIKYVYDYNATQDKWTKDFLEVPVEGPFTSAYDQLFADTTWTAYNEQTGEISGSWKPSEQIVSQYPDATGDSFDVVLKFTQSGAELNLLGSNARIFDVGKTQISLPQTYIDNTIENQDIYSVDEQGNYDFNLVLMKEVLLDWMKGNNQYNKEIFTEVTASNDVETKDILFIEASENNISVSFLAHWKTDDALTLESLTIIDRDLYSAIQNQTIKTKEEFATHLHNMKRNRVSKGNYITIDTTLSKSDFETITTNIFNHLVNVGTHHFSINEEGVKHPEYADAKVLFGFSDKGGDNIGYDLGQTWTQRFYYLIELNGQIELLKVGVVCEQNINRLINDTPNKWLIRDDQLNELEQMDVKNKEILPEEKYISSDNNYQ